MTFYDQEHDRDRRLGAALRALDTPEHAPSFWEDLEADLSDVGARPRVAVGGDPAQEPHVLATPAEVRTSAAATRRSIPRRLRQRRFPRPARRRPPRAAAAPPRRRAPRLGRPRPRRRRAGLLLVGGILALLVAALVWATDARPPGRDDAGRAATTSAAPGATTAPTGSSTPPLAGVPASWAGELVRAETDGRGRTTTRRYAVVARQDGATRLTALDGGQPADLGEDPAIGVRVTVGAAGTRRTTGLSPGGLEPGGADDLLGGHYADVVAAQALAGDPAVSADTLDGRAVWRFSAALEPDAPDHRGADLVELVVDQDLRVPLHVVERRDGVVLLEQTLFLVAPPAEAPGLPPVEPGSPDETGGWRPAAAAEARLVARGVPGGFEAVAAGVADDTPGLGVGGVNPSARASQVVYRRGWERIVVTVWAAGQDPARWSDPLAVEGLPVHAVPAVLTGGSLAGVTAQVVVQADDQPRLWAVGAGHVVLVTGPLPAAGLVAVASSLAPPS